MQIYILYNYIFKNIFQGKQDVFGGSFRKVNLFVSERI